MLIHLWTRELNLSLSCQNTHQLPTLSRSYQTFPPLLVSVFGKRVRDHSTARLHSVDPLQKLGDAYRGEIHSLLFDWFADVLTFAVALLCATVVPGGAIPIGSVRAIAAAAHVRHVHS